MNLLTNWGPLSLMTFFGNPCSEKTLSRYSVAIPLDVTVELVGRKNDFFVNRSTTTKMVSKPFNSGSRPIMSTEIICHGRVEGGCLCLSIWFDRLASVATCYIFLDVLFHPWPPVVSHH